MRKGKVILSSVVALVVAAGLSSPASAQHPSFIDGISSTAAVGIEGAWGDDTDGLDPSWAFAVALAPRFSLPVTGPTKIMLEAGPFLQYGSLSPDSGDWSRLMMGIEGRLGFQLGSAQNMPVELTPYVYGAVGMHKDEWEQTYGSYTVTLSDTAAFVAIGAGLEMAVLPEVKVGARLRLGYFFWDEWSSEPDSGGRDPSINHWDFMLTATYLLTLGQQ